MANKTLHHEVPVSDPRFPPEGLSQDATPLNHAPADANTAQPPVDSREHKLLKSNRKGVGGPKTKAGKEASRLNALQHGCYALRFYLLPWENQHEYDAHAARLTALTPPTDETTAEILALRIQAAWRLGRCNYAEFLAYNTNRDDPEKRLRAIQGVGRLRSGCERSFYLHLEKLNLAHATLRQNLLNIEAEQKQEDAKPVKEYTADGEEIHAGWPQYAIRKLSCLPDDPLNVRLNFIRTVSNKYTTEETPLRDFEGGRYLDPSIKPYGMKGEWPDYALPQPPKDS